MATDGKQPQPDAPEKVKTVEVNDPDYEQATEPIAVDPTLSRWHVRAASVSDCVEKLSEVWSAAAEEASHSDVAEERREEALADPRMAAQMDATSAVRVRMRTSVLTLVVLAPR